MREQLLSGVVGGAVVFVGMTVLGVGRVQPPAESGKPQPAGEKGNGDAVVFKDAEGRPRIGIVADPDPAMFFADKKGNRLLTLAVVNDTPIVQLSSAYDKQGIMLQVQGRNGSYLLVQDPKKQSRISIGGSDSYFEMALKEPGLKDSFLVNVGGDGAPIMLLNDWRTGHRWWEPKIDHEVPKK